MSTDRNGVTHPKCPDCRTVWRQSGNRTGHCSGCHRTFQGESAFDRHQSISDGKVTCMTVETMARDDGAPLYEGVNIDGVVYWSLRLTDAQRARFARLKAERDAAEPDEPLAWNPAVSW